MQDDDGEIVDDPENDLGRIQEDIIDVPPDNIRGRGENWWGWAKSEK